VRDDGLALVFAGYRLPVGAGVVAARPALSDWVGRSLILGIRPPDFEDGALAEPGWPRLAARAEVTEDLGSEIHVIFTIDAPPLEHPELSRALPGGEEDETALAMDGLAMDGGALALDGGALGLDGGALALDGGKSRWTARVSARSQVRPGEPAELAVDPASLYFFGPESGRAIGTE
jgi:multiple sugar transport system ATP-binding protein